MSAQGKENILWFVRNDPSECRSHNPFFAHLPTPHPLPTFSFCPVGHAVFPRVVTRHKGISRLVVFVLVVVRCSQPRVLSSSGKQKIRLPLRALSHSE